MEKKIFLEILTPERMFFSGEVDLVTVTLSDGLFTVLPGHAPFISALAVGELSIKTGDTYQHAYHSEGFIEINSKNHIEIFVHVCSWPSEIQLTFEEDTLEKTQKKLCDERSQIKQIHIKESIIRTKKRIEFKNKFSEE